jgi:hypothetical protein
MKEFELTVMKLIVDHYEQMVRAGRADLIQTWGKYYEAYRAMQAGQYVAV